VSSSGLSARSGTGWQWRTSRTGAALARVSTAAHTTRAAETMGPVSGPGQITVVIDPADGAEFARGFAPACRRAGRFVVHTSPRQRWAWRMQTEVLTALGKHWDRPVQGGDATVAQLAQAWLRAERARDLVVLRAHHRAGPALDWLLSLPAQEGLRLWLISPRPLPWTDTATHVTVTRADQVATSPILGGGQSEGCRCEDLNQHADLATPDAAVATDPAVATGPALAAHPAAATDLSVATAKRLRRLYGLEAAALATATVLLGRPTPDTVAAAGVRVANDGRSLATVHTTEVAIPEHARALVRGWAGRHLPPPHWAHDVAATYLTLRLEMAERHSAVRLLDPALPPLRPIVWHERYGPGAAELSALTRSRALGWRERTDHPRHHIVALSDRCG
jgi:hypothetical protein